MPGRSRLAGRRALAAAALTLVALVAFSRLPYLSLSPTNITHNGYTPLDTAQNVTNGVQATHRPIAGGVTMLAVLCRFDENISWIIDPNVGLYNSKTKRFLLPIEIYNTADLEPGMALPRVPGLLPPPPANLSHLPSHQLRALNYSSSQPRKLPTWPQWAWDWAIEKNATAGAAAPGSVEEAELLAHQAAGLPHPDHPPTTAAEWRAYESLEGWTEAADSAAGFNASEALKKKGKRVFGSPKRSTTVLAPDISPVLPLRIVPNRGAEAMAYLSAIIDHYDDLPDLMIFGHSSRISWHSIFGLDWTLRRLATLPPADPTLSSTNGYHAWNCLERWANDNARLFPATIDASWRSPNGPMWHEALAARFAQAWEEHLGAALGGAPLPAVVRVPAAASFVAARQAIQRRPKQFWMDLRDWMLRTPLETKWLGIVMEFATGVIFANHTVITYSQERCMCELYSICTGYSEI